MAGQENYLEKDALLDIQKKLAKVSKMKRGNINDKPREWSGKCFGLDLQKTFLKASKKSVWWDEEDLMKN